MLTKPCPLLQAAKVSIFILTLNTTATQNVKDVACTDKPTKCDHTLECLSAFCFGKTKPTTRDLVQSHQYCFYQGATPHCTLLELVTSW